MMFNETSYSSRLGALGDQPGLPSCEAAKSECEKRFPVDEHDPSLSNEAYRQRVTMHLQCLDSFNCGGKVIGYDNPGATTYPWDVLTNSDNPNTIWQWPEFIKDIAEQLGTTPAVIALGGGLIALLGVGFMARRR